MKNFIFKSTDADLQKMFQSIETIQKNVLYSSHRIDSCIKTLDVISTFMVRINKQLDFEGKFSKTLDDYVEETSPQTDSEEQNGPS